MTSNLMDKFLSAQLPKTHRNKDNELRLQRMQHSFDLGVN